MKTIINADDFGYSEKVNQAVKICFEKKVINQTTIMVNMPAAENAAEMAKQNGFFESVGLHINLTEGPALSEICKNSDLCDENGILKGIFHIPITARFFLNSNIRRAIAAETEAQIKRYLEMGFPLMHADSHNYTHTYWSVAKEVLPLLVKYRFQSVRISRNIPPEDISFAFRPYKYLYNRKLSGMSVGGKPVYTTRYFGDVKDFERYFQNRKMDGDAEIMTHPVLGADGSVLDTDKPMISGDWLKSRGVSLR